MDQRPPVRGPLKGQSSLVGGPDGSEVASQGDRVDQRSPFRGTAWGRGRRSRARVGQRSPFRRPEGGSQVKGYRLKAAEED